MVGHGKPGPAKSVSEAEQRKQSNARQRKYMANKKVRLEAEADQIERYPLSEPVMAPVLPSEREEIRKRKVAVD